MYVVTALFFLYFFALALDKCYSAAWQRSGAAATGWA